MDMYRNGKSNPPEGVFVKSNEDRARFLLRLTN